MIQRRPPRWILARALAWALVLWAVVLPRPAVAAPEAGSHQARPVIVAGREAEVMALLRPYALGDEVADGWVLRAVAIDVGTITVQLARPRRSPARLTLDHHGYGPPGARELPGFSLAVVQQPPGSERAVERIVAAIERNDDATFWDDAVLATEPRAHPFQSQWVGAGTLYTAEAWLRDGLVFLATLVLTLLVLVAVGLREAPRGTTRWLLAVVALGAVLRVALSPAVALAPWPYTRVLLPAEMIFHGPGLAALHPEPVWLSETILSTSLAFSLLAPLAVYVHARYLLDDHRAALWAALIMAILPLHLRFSHGDTAFIPSITISSIVFSLVHAAVSGRSGAGRSGRAAWLAVAMVGVPLLVVYEIRPLNLVYFPLLLATAFVRQGLHTDKPRVDRTRTIATFAVLAAVTVGLGVPHLLEHFGTQVQEGLRPSTLGAGLRVLIDPRHNELLNPVFTPPGLVVLAGLGIADLWRRGRRRLLWFLVAWLLTLLLAHAYVVPESMYMQARYHLHLVVPFVLLVVCGADAALRWLAAAREQGRPWLGGHRYTAIRLGALGYVLASPLLHLHGIRHVALNDVHEWRFVHGLRDQIAPRCTVAEYDSRHYGERLRRVGHWVQGGVPRERWASVVIRSTEDVRALAADPPACLYWYEGLPCFGAATSGETEAAACRAMAQAFALEPIAATRFDSAPYDENLAQGLGDREQVELRLYRAVVDR